MPEEIKNCPFCDQRALLELHRPFRIYTSGEASEGISIQCGECPAEMLFCREDFPGMSDEEIVGMLTQQWNRRAA